MRVHIRNRWLSAAKQMKLRAFCRTRPHIYGESRTTANAFHSTKMPQALKPLTRLCPYVRLFAPASDPLPDEQTESRAAPYIRLPARHTPS
ncbi:hypothetical protein X945_5765 [Burkholderia pseudomallei ABCPW 107]|nr:hypothetical protein X945_5765 [Burkholderia pseudomallei ABCPW 107]